MTNAIRVRQDILIKLEEHARSNPKEECCGLLAGDDDTITDLFPARNILASATAYEIAPEELFHLFRAMRDARLQHLGIYHSHVTGANVPSPRDIAQAYYSGVAHFIISPRASAPKPIRAFSIQGSTVTELQITPVP